MTERSEDAPPYLAPGAWGVDGPFYERVHTRDDDAHNSSMDPPQRPDMWMLQIISYHDDYKLRGEMPSETYTWLFESKSEAKEHLREWCEEYIKDNIDDPTVDEITERCEESIKDFKMEEWCDEKGVPLPDCPCVDTFMNALFLAEFVPCSFKIKIEKIQTEKKRRVCASE